MDIREIQITELDALLALYAQLHDNDIAEISESIEKLWLDILSCKNHHIIVGVEDGLMVSTCAITIILNLTHQQKPYALIENVVTHKKYRNRGYATSVLNYARELAKKEGCYKIMLLTGSKNEKTLKFYEKAGYNSKDKTAFIQWI